MNAVGMVRNNRKELLGLWLETFFETKPGAGLQARPDYGDRFTNPVYHTINEELPKIYDYIVDENLERDSYLAALKNIIRIRAVQDMKPSQAVSFLFRLKEIIFDSVGLRDADLAGRKRLAEYCDNIDDAVLDAMDIFMEMREKIFDIKIKEIKNRYNKVFE
jgi:hypothetical protein